MTDTFLAVYSFFRDTYVELAGQPGTKYAKLYWAYVQSISMFKDMNPKEITQRFEELGWHIDMNRGIMWKERGRNGGKTSYNPRRTARRARKAVERQSILRGRGDIGG